MRYNDILAFGLTAGLFCANMSVRADEPDALLDYIGSTGAGQYIDTGYVFKGAHGAPRVVATATIFNKDGDVCGTRNAAAGCFIVDYDAASYDGLYYRYGHGDASVSWNCRPLTTTVGPYKDIMLNYEWGPSVYHAGKLVGTTASYDFSKNSQSFLLFRGRTAPMVRFREVRLYDGDVLVRHYRAASKNGVGCMYEVLSGTLVYNAGSGSFELGGQLRTDVSVVGEPAAYGTATPAYGASTATINTEVAFSIGGATLYDDGVTAYPSSSGLYRAFLKEAVAQSVGGLSATNTSVSFAHDVGDSSCQVTWRFTNVQARVTFSAHGGGKVSVGGAAAVVDGQLWKTVGETVRLAAVADEGWEFSRWVADGFSSSASSIELPVLEPRQVYAVFRRPGGTVGCYVQNGLVANWDALDNVATGRQEIESTNAWIDVVGFRSVTLTNVTVMSKSLFFPSSGYGLLAQEDTTAVFGCASTKTVEILAHLVASDCHIALMTPAACGVAFGAAYGNINVTSAAKSRRILISDFSKTNTYAIVYTNGIPKVCYTNGELSEMSSTEDLWSPTSFKGASFGRRWGGGSPYPLTDSICAIRVYARELSPREIARNARWDRRRYQGEKMPGMFLLVR